MSLPILAWKSKLRFPRNRRVRLVPAPAGIASAGQHMMNYFNASVVHGGHLYGIHSLDHVPRNSTLRCIELATGQVKWDKEGVGLASVLLLGRRLLVLTDKGELVLADAAPAAYEELGRAKVLDGNCWTSPVPHDRRVYCRNCRGDIVCLDMAARQRQ